MMRFNAAVESGKPYWVEDSTSRGGDPWTDECFVGSRRHGKIWYGHRALYSGSERERRFYAALLIPFWQTHPALYPSGWTNTETFHSIDEAKAWVETHEVRFIPPRDMEIVEVI